MNDSSRQEKWTHVQFEMFPQQTWTALPSAISSAASPDGPSPSSLLGGLKIAPSGQAHAPASPSVQQESKQEQPTSGTYGLSSQGSSEPVSLQQLLASRLQANLAGIGSPEYSLTWKTWDISGQEPICALRASGRRTSGKDCGGWGTPRATDGTHGPEQCDQSCRLGESPGGLPTLRVDDRPGAGLERQLPTASEEREEHGFRPKTGLASQAGLPSWNDSFEHLCRDGKHRRIPSSAESLFQRMADGLPAYLDSDGSEGFPLVGKGKTEHRAKLLKGYGNAIVPAVGSAFIRALLEVIS
jgi:hypothetical protein